MSSLFDELSKKARALIVEERAQLAQELLESVARVADPDVEAAWEVEIARPTANRERQSAFPLKRSFPLHVASHGAAESFPWWSMLKICIEYA